MQKAGAEVGIKVRVHHYDDAVSTEQIVSLIQQLNANPEVSGIIVQLPLPPQIDRQGVLNAIAAHKDVDGLSDVNKRHLANLGSEIQSGNTADGIHLVHEARQKPYSPETLSQTPHPRTPHPGTPHRAYGERVGVVWSVGVILSVCTAG